jgi:hypothetical protein
VIHVVGDGDIFAEDGLADAAGEAGALVGNGGGRKIVEEEADEVQDCGGFQDDGIAPGLERDGILGARSFVACRFRQSRGIEPAKIRGVLLGPAGG